MRPKNSKRIYSEIKIKKPYEKKFLKQLIVNKGLIQIVSCKSFFNEGILGMKKDINFLTKSTGKMNFKPWGKFSYIAQKYKNKTSIVDLKSYFCIRGKKI